MGRLRGLGISGYGGIALISGVVSMLPRRMPAHIEEGGQSRPYKGHFEGIDRSTPRPFRVREFPPLENKRPRKRPVIDGPSESRSNRIFENVCRSR